MSMDLPRPTSGGGGGPTKGKGLSGASSGATGLIANRTNLDDETAGSEFRHRTVVARGTGHNRVTLPHCLQSLRGVFLRPVGREFTSRRPSHDRRGADQAQWARTQGAATQAVGDPNGRGDPEGGDLATLESMAALVG